MILWLLALTALPSPATSVVAPAPFFTVAFRHWDRRAYEVTLPAGAAVLGWPGRTVRVIPHLPHGSRAVPRFAAQSRGRGAERGWELVVGGGAESVALTFRIHPPRGVAYDTGLVLLVPQPFAVDAAGMAHGRGFTFPLGHYPVDVPTRFRARGAALGGRLYVVRDQSLVIAPGFTLGMFLSHTRPGRERTQGVHLLALDYALVDALVTIQKAWTSSGRPGRIRVESPFRTPDYNDAGAAGRATFSQHMYGSAADIIATVDDDRRHDDINGDGVRDTEDILPLARLAKRLMAQGKIPRGGIGVYRYVYRDGRSSELTVHVDVRGYITTWGQFYDSDTVHPAGRIDWN